MAEDEKFDYHEDHLEHTDIYFSVVEVKLRSLNNRIQTCLVKWTDGQGVVLAIFWNGMKPEYEKYAEALNHAFGTSDSKEKR